MISRGNVLLAAGGGLVLLLVFIFPTLLSSPEEGERAGQGLGPGEVQASEAGAAAAHELDLPPETLVAAATEPAPKAAPESAAPVVKATKAEPKLEHVKVKGWRKQNVKDTRLPAPRKLAQKSKGAAHAFFEGAAKKKQDAIKKRTQGSRRSAAHKNANKLAARASGKKLPYMTKKHPYTTKQQLQKSKNQLEKQLTKKGKKHHRRSQRPR